MTAAPRMEAPKRRTLHEIVREMIAVIDDSGGEVTARVDELGLELTDKAEAYCAVMRELAAEREKLEELSRAYKVMAAARDEAITGLKFRLDQALTAAGVEKLKTPSSSIYYQTSSSVHVEREQEFLGSAPDRFVNVKQSVNRTAIKEALEAGEVVEGAELRTARHLRFR